MTMNTKSQWSPDYLEDFKNMHIPLNELAATEAVMAGKSITKLDGGWYYTKDINSFVDVMDSAEQTGVIIYE